MDTLDNDTVERMLGNYGENWFGYSIVD